MKMLIRIGAYVLAGMPLAAVTGSLHAQSVQEELSVDLQDVAAKFVALASAMPETSYTWAPGNDVRSVGAVFGHVAGASIIILQRGGAAIPADVPGNWYEAPDGLVDKAEIVQALERAMAFLADEIENATEEELERRVDLLGRPSTYRATLIFALAHAHEHLGQSIAYARMVGITPPWNE